MLDPVLLVIAGIIIALAFDFGNGFNDAANAISTVVATQVLSMRGAVLMAAFFNMVGAFVFGTAVAATIGKGLIEPGAVNEVIILSGVIGAIVWVYLTSFMGIPISASHSLIGGFIGAAIAGAGLQSLIASGILKVVLFIFIAPILGLIGAFFFFSFILHLVKNRAPEKINRHFRRLQLISASVYSLGHGTNDAQKTMGIIAILLFTGGFLGGEFHVPFWVVLLSHGTIAAGTMAGGWRVVKTLGLKITKLRPIHGFCAETAGAATIIGSTLAGIPVSTTHVIAGSIFGIGVTKRFSAVRWTVARKIVWAWAITIPFATSVGFVSYFIVNYLVNLF